METIQIAIPCGSNCEKYVEFLISTIEKTVSDEHQLEYLFGISHKNVNVSYLEKIESKFPHRNILMVQPEISSAGHARTLDSLLDNVSSEYAMFIDCDVSMLKKDWDIEMKSVLKDDVVIVGSEYVGAKYHNFPNVVVCMFRTKIIKDLGISFMPGGNIVIKNQKEAKMYSREIGDQIFLDVGCQLPHKIKTNGYNGCVMPVFNRKDDSAQFMTNGLRGTEYQLFGKVIASHVGRSLTRDFDKNDIIKAWRKKSLDWLS